MVASGGDDIGITNPGDPNTTASLWLENFRMNITWEFSNDDSRVHQCSLRRLVIKRECGASLVLNI